MKVKICGITNSQNYLQALSLGADYCGFIFYPKSPRYVNPFMLIDILNDRPATTNQVVGVFVNEDLEKVRELYLRLSLDILQLHGDESPDYVNRLGLPCWKAIRVKNQHSLGNLSLYNCQGFLLDTYKEEKYGGTGESLDLKLVEIALKSGKKIILSGGLSAKNIQAVFNLEYLPFAIDVNSSIESKPGTKSPRKMECFFNTFKNLKGI
jgi:phosphoribosylanthranilate isomerase